MKSKNPKNQVLTKGLAILLCIMFLATPIAYAATSLDDGYLVGTAIEQLFYGTVGSTVKEIERYFESKTVLYIFNEVQLRAFAEYVNNGHDCEGKRIVLSNNIELNSNEEWKPIGNILNPFKGSFDGAEYTISGLNFNRGNKLYSEITNIGLFGYVEKANIKNIKLANLKIDIPYNISTDILVPTTDAKDIFKTNYSKTGGIVGYNNQGTIENCILESDTCISAASQVGGIVGYNKKGLIKKSTNKGTVNGLYQVGGIVGLNFNEQTEAESEKIPENINCTNYGKVSALIQSAGGIAGANIDNVKIQGCKNYGDINVSKEQINLYVNGIKQDVEVKSAGGIVGDITKAIAEGLTIIYSCENYGQIYGLDGIAAIAGSVNAIEGNVLLSNCKDYYTRLLIIGKKFKTENSSIIVNECFFNMELSDLDFNGDGVVTIGTKRTDGEEFSDYLAGESIEKYIEENIEKYGDIDYSGTIDTNDLNMMIRMDKNGDKIIKEDELPKVTNLDLNGDSKVTTGIENTDAKELERYIEGDQTNANVRSHGDINYDGSINTTDLEILKRMDKNKNEVVSADEILTVDQLNFSKDEKEIVFPPNVSTITINKTRNNRLSCFRFICNYVRSLV